MSTVRAVASRYAKAFSDAVPAGDAFMSAVRSMRGLANAVAASSDLKRTLANPVINTDSKRRVARALLEARTATPHALRFVDLLAENDRLVLVEEIAAALERERNRREGVHEVALSSASPLDDAVRQRIVTALESVAGGTVRVTESVDPELLGGVVARVGETLYDASLKTRLEQMRERMAGEGAGSAG